MFVRNHGLPKNKTRALYHSKTSICMGGGVGSPNGRAGTMTSPLHPHWANTTQAIPGLKEGPSRKKLYIIIRNAPRYCARVTSTSIITAIGTTPRTTPTRPLNTSNICMYSSNSPMLQQHLSQDRYLNCILLPMDLTLIRTNATFTSQRLPNSHNIALSFVRKKERITA